MKTDLALLTLIIIVSTIGIHAEDQNIFITKKEIVLDERKEQLQAPVSVVIDKTSNLYILDRRRSSIFKYNSKGKYLKTLAKPGLGPGEIQMVSNIDIDSNDIIHYFDKRKLSYTKIDTDGKVKSTSKSTEFGDEIYLTQDDKLLFSKHSQKGQCRLSVRKAIYERTNCLVRETGISDTGSIIIDYMCVEKDTTGNLYIAEPLEYKVTVFDNKYQIIDLFGDPSDYYKPYPGKLKIKKPKAAQEWWDSFCTVDELVVFSNKYLMIIFDCEKKPGSSHNYDLYDLKTKKRIHSGILPPNYKYVGKDRKGKPLFLKNETTKNGTDVVRKLIQVKINEVKLDSLK